MFCYEHIIRVQRKGTSIRDSRNVDMNPSNISIFLRDSSQVILRMGRILLEEVLVCVIAVRLTSYVNPEDLANS